MKSPARKVELPELPVWFRVAGYLALISWVAIVAKIFSISNYGQ